MSLKSIMLVHNDNKTIRACENRLRIDAAESPSLARNARARGYGTFRLRRRSPLGGSRRNRVRGRGRRRRRNAAGEARRIFAASTGLSTWRK